MMVTQEQGLKTVHLKGNEGRNKSTRQEKKRKEMESKGKEMKDKQRKEEEAKNMELFGEGSKMAAPW